MSRALAHGRALARLTLIIATSSALALLRVAIEPLLWITPRHRGRAGLRIAAIWGAALTRILGLRCRVLGEPPRPPALLVTNHLSYVDILVLLRRCPGVFVARADVARWPFLGALARLAGTHFVDRGRKRDLPRVIDAMAASLGDGLSVVFFPEATSSPGVTVLPFRAPLFEASIRSGVPVAAAALCYTVPGHPKLAARAVCWWGEMTFADHAYRLLQLRRIEATLHFGVGDLRAEDREALAAAARGEVEALFRAIEPGGGPDSGDAVGTRRANLASTRQ